MAATPTILRSAVVGDHRAVDADVALDNSYPTGGYTLAPSKFGFGLRINSVIPQNTGGKIYEWDATNGKLLAYSAVGTQVTNATDLSAVTVRVRAAGV